MVLRSIYKHNQILTKFSIPSNFRIEFSKTFHLLTKLFGSDELILPPIAWKCLASIIVVNIDLINNPFSLIKYVQIADMLYEASPIMSHIS